MNDLVTWLRAQLDDDERLITEYGRYMGERGIAAGTYVLVTPPGWSSGEPFDPDRQAAEVEAKRRLIDEHDPDWPRLECPTCCGYDGNDNYGVERRPREAYPCRVVKLLALPYADQPGYKEEWRP